MELGYFPTAGYLTLIIANKKRMQLFHMSDLNQESMPGFTCNSDVNCQGRRMLSRIIAVTNAMTSWNEHNATITLNVFSQSAQTYIYTLLSIICYISFDVCVMDYGQIYIQLNGMATASRVLCGGWILLLAKMTML